jgi:hypothetical protein
MNKGDLVSVEESLLRRIYRSDKRYIDILRQACLPRQAGSVATGRPTSRAFAPDPKMKLSFLLTLKV